MIRYVLKTVMNGETKCFINMCENEKIGKPSSEMGVGDGGKRGLQWSIPHSLGETLRVLYIQKYF